MKKKIGTYIIQSGYFWNEFMLTFLLVFHFLVTLLLIGLVLVQKHEGGGLSAGLSSAANGFMTSRGQANFLTKTTAILMAIFIVNCLCMAKIAKNSHKQTSIVDTAAQELKVPHSDFDQTSKTIFSGQPKKTNEKQEKNNVQQKSDQAQSK